MKKNLIIVAIFAMFFVACNNCPEAERRDIPYDQKFICTFGDTFIYKSNFENYDTFVVNSYENNDDMTITERDYGEGCVEMYLDLIVVGLTLLNDTIHNFGLLRYFGGDKTILHVIGLKGYSENNNQIKREYKDNVEIDSVTYKDVLIMSDTVSQDEEIPYSFCSNNIEGLISYEYLTGEKYSLLKTIKQ